MRCCTCASACVKCMRKLHHEKTFHFYRTSSDRRLFSLRLDRDAALESRRRAGDRMARAHLLAGLWPPDPGEDPFRIRRRAPGRWLAPSDAGKGMGELGVDEAGRAGEVSGGDA